MTDTISAVELANLKDDYQHLTTVVDGLSSNLGYIEADCAFLKQDVARLGNFIQSHE